MSHTLPCFFMSLYRFFISSLSFARSLLIFSADLWANLTSLAFSSSLILAFSTFSARACSARRFRSALESWKMSLLLICLPWKNFDRSSEELITFHHRKELLMCNWRLSSAHELLWIFSSLIYRLFLFSWEFYLLSFCFFSLAGLLARLGSFFTCPAATHFSLELINIL